MEWCFLSAYLKQYSQLSISVIIAMSIQSLHKKPAEINTEVSWKKYLINKNTFSSENEKLCTIFLSLDAV